MASSCEPARADSTARSSEVLRISVVRSNPVKGIFRTASMPRSGFWRMGFCGTVSMMVATFGSASRIDWATWLPETRPWSSASTITMSGFRSPTAPTAFSPLVTTSRTLICDWALSSERMWDATCGTSSITRSRICSPAKCLSTCVRGEPSVVAAIVRRPSSDDHDAALAFRVKRLEVVRPIGRVNREARLVDQAFQRYPRWIPEPEAGRKPRYRTIGSYGVGDRRIGDPEALGSLATGHLRAPDDRLTLHFTLPVHGQGQFTGGKAAGAQQVKHRDAGRRQHAGYPREHPIPLLGSVEVRENPNADNQVKALGQVRPPDIALHDDQATGSRRLRQNRVSGNARLRPSQERRRPVEAHEGASATVDQRSEEAAGAAAEIERPTLRAACHLAVEEPILNLFLVLKVVEGREQVRICRLPCKDVRPHAAHPSRPRHHCPGPSAPRLSTRPA